MVIRIRINWRRPSIFRSPPQVIAPITGICVVIPAKNEELVITRCLKSIINAGVPPSDIYLIDDGSTDKTSQAAAACGVNVARNSENIGKAESVRKCVELFGLSSRYEYLALMDADSCVRADYFNEVKRAFEKNKNIVTVCGQAKSIPHNWLTSYRCLSYFISHFVYKGGQTKMGVITVAPGCATTYKTSVFNQLEWGGSIVEDMDVTVQIHYKKLGRIVYHNKAIVYTQDPRNLRDYARQLFRWHTGAFQVGRKFKMFTGLKKIDWEYKLLMGEGLIFASMFLLFPLWLAMFPKIMTWGLLMDLALTMCLASVAGAANRRKDVVIFSPTFLLLRYVDCAVFVYSFWHTILRRKTVSDWLSVKRYNQQTEI